MAKTRSNKLEQQKLNKQTYVSDDNLTSLENPNDVLQRLIKGLRDCVDAYSVELIPYKLLEPPQKVEEAYFLSNLEKEDLRGTRHFNVQEDIKSVAVIPIYYKDQLIILTINYHTQHQFSLEEKEMLFVIAEHIKLSLEPLSSKTENTVNLVLPNMIQFRFDLSPFLQVGDFLDTVADKIWSIELIYSIYAILGSENITAIENLIEYLRKYQKGSFIGAKFQLNNLLDSIKVEPLKVSSMHYGSPVTFDLLGIGNLLEQVRDTIKDMSWRGEHEKRIAELELVKIQNENEKIAVEIAKQKLELIEKTKKIKLSKAEKNLLISALARELNIINTPNTYMLLPSGDVEGIQKQVKRKNSVKKSRKKYKK